MIASVSLTEGKILVTNNTHHYDRIIRLQLENWSRNTWKEYAKIDRDIFGVPISTEAETIAARIG